MSNVGKIVKFGVLFKSVGTIIKKRNDGYVVENSQHARYLISLDGEGKSWIEFNEQEKIK
jgi:hypothetical protein